MDNFTLEDITFDFNSPHFITKIANPIVVSISAIYYRCYAIFVLHKKLPEITKSLQQIDALLHVPQIHHKHDSKRLSLYITFIVMIFPFQMYTIWNVSQGFNLYLPFYLIALSNNYALESTEFLFTSICYLIETRFNYISRKLQQKNRPKEAINSICKTVDTFTFLRESTSKQNYEDLIAANEMQIVRSAFQKLIRLSEVVNSQFNIRLLVALAVCTFNVLTNLYMGLFGVGYGNGNGKLYVIVTSILWACFYFTRLIWICTACEFLCKEANTVKGSLSGVLNRSWGKLTKEEVTMNVYK